ncbi:MAG TPA: anti-sigma F factor [Thermoclostridium caenicola]|uniref:Anti-sigma F factor n=1 Tax=Thermoclostridium caenicola TaxID=659425 RepID=A0A1M6GWW3_9FIRM|nr:anti-sigma F factor [Thermoclostridium caenicola]SHJ14345.1 stage II sporulation protein AB (anti-sigma F factor) [Thermoclostridium caenicola]HOK42501.1 anti-sigma F factor [Thermoclostridium caenicola]HOL84510.1 anti-sigma F factor [Thermoclostridium caenicola]HOP72638.1 anti-sigma F factor [Thermoclostridium caenicola]HPO76420.1 anti-sigma F factor [Thermoclostridium caenicola]
MEPINKMRTEFLSKSVNESFARVVAASFAAQVDPSIEVLADIRTAVSEAVTNAIIHGYGEEEGMVVLSCVLYPDFIEITVEDFGKGIEDVEKAKTPLFTTRPDLERTGMGFTVMETFMDSLEVESKPGQGTKVRMTKKLKNR